MKNMTASKILNFLTQSTTFYDLNPQVLFNVNIPFFQPYFTYIFELSLFTVCSSVTNRPTKTKFIIATRSVGVDCTHNRYLLRASWARERSYSRSERYQFTCILSLFLELVCYRFTCILLIFLELACYSRCRETPVSRTALSLIAVVFQAFFCWRGIKELMFLNQ